MTPPHHDQSDRSRAEFERALVAVRAFPPPPPPPFDSTRLSRPSSPVRFRVLAGIATAVAASVAFAWVRTSPDVAVLPFEVRLGAEFLKAAPREGWDANGPVRLTVGRTEVDVEAGSRFSIALGTRIDVHFGRASFHVTGRGAPSREGREGLDAIVLAGRVPIIDRGTTFGVDVSRGSGHESPGTRVLVTVTEGSVTAAGTEIRAGHGLAFVEGRPLGAAWPLDAKPALSLESETAGSAAGEPVVLRLVFANPTDGWIPWPSSSAVESPLHVEVTNPDGSVTPVRVTDAMLVDGFGGSRAIPPRDRSVLRVRFDRTFASPGTYRLRVVFRPAEAVEDPTSAALSLTVREAESPASRIPPTTTPPPTTGGPR